MSEGLFLLILIVGAIGFSCVLALILGCVLWLAASADRRLEREADGIVNPVVAELERVYALAAREPVR